MKMGIRFDIISGIRLQSYDVKMPDIQIQRPIFTRPFLQPTDSVRADQLVNTFAVRYFFRR